MESSRLIKEVMRQARLTEDQKRRLQSLKTDDRQMAYRMQCLLAKIKKIESDFRRTVRRADGRRSEATHHRIGKLLAAAIELGDAVGLDEEDFERFLFAGWSPHMPDLDRLRRQHLKMILSPIFSRGLGELDQAIRSFRGDLRRARISERLSRASVSHHARIILAAARSMASITSYSREMFERDLVQQAHGGPRLP